MGGGLVRLVLFAFMMAGATVAAAFEQSAEPLTNVVLLARSKQTQCLIQATSQVLPDGWEPMAYLVSTIETADKELASITFIARNLKLGEGTTFDLLVTSFDPQGWSYYKNGHEMGLVTGKMKPTAQLVQRRSATRIGVVDLSRCQ